jgi:alpha-beta hydrolase superfamily lysophospholipase
MQDSRSECKDTDNALKHYCPSTASTMLSLITSLFSSKDLTYGRASLPYCKKELVFRSPPYHYTEHTIPFPNHPTYPNANHFIYYQTWLLSNVKQRNVDVLIVHGLDYYGGHNAENVDELLQGGFRIISLDLPSFGRSSGRHSYLNDWKELTEAVRCVIDHLKKGDEYTATNNPSSIDPTLPLESRPKSRKLVLSGRSLGGLVALSYSILYPSTIDALHLFAPLVFVSESSRPSKFVEYVAKVIAQTPLGYLPISNSKKGQSSSDPKVEEEFMNGTERCACKSEAKNKY